MDVASYVVQVRTGACFETDLTRRARSDESISFKPCSCAESMAFPFGWQSISSSDPRMPPPVGTKFLLLERSYRAVVSHAYCVYLP